METMKRGNDTQGSRLVRFVVTAVLLTLGLAIASTADAAVQDAENGKGVELPSATALADEVRSADGVVRFEFAARSGVWGNGRTWNISRDESASRRHHCDGCTNGPIRVTVRVENGREVELRSQVGGAWKADGRDLDRPPASVAADYLLRLAERGDRALDAESREAALQAAVSADGGVDWQRLLGIARDRGQAPDVRQAALFWTAHEAGERAASGIEEIAVASEEDTEVQEAAVFALTQLPEERGTDALLRLARENRNPDIVQSVYFWLGQRDDPRVLALFEEVLLD